MISKIEQEWIKSRKDKDEVVANLYGTLVSEIRRVAKDDGQREITEVDCVSVIKKFIKNLDQTITDLKKVGRNSSKEEREKSLVESFLPHQLEESELKEIISEFITEMGVKGNLKAMGQVMAKLKQGFGGQYDGKKASDLVKELIA